jgi:hypothetical protein
MSTKVIGVDLDGTLAEYSGWKGCDKIGDPLPGAAKLLSCLKAAGWTVCIWTTRSDVYVRKWLSAHQLTPFVDYVNESPYPTDSGKQSFDLYLGDEALRFSGPDSVETLLEKIGRIERSRHWGSSDSFVRNAIESDHNPLLYYQGTGKVFLDIFDGLTEKLWAEKKDYNPVALLTICSHAKPYSKSWIHCEIRKALYSSDIVAGQSHTKLLKKIDFIHLSSSGIIPHETSISGMVNRYDWNGADIKHDEVKTLLRERIKIRLQTWFSTYGTKYNTIVVYLRPTGNTLAAVMESGIPCKVSTVVEYPSHPWMENPDVDDCLADPLNLQILQMNLRKVVLGKYLTKQVGMTRKDPPGFRTAQGDKSKEGRF